MTKQEHAFLMNGSPPSMPSFGRAAGFGVLLAALAFVVYWPAMFGEFIWDDKDIYIVGNKLLREPDGLRRFWFTTEPIDYYPLTYTTFWLEWRWWKLQPVGYHAVNVALHAMTAWFLWMALKELGARAAWAAALWFLLHPVAVESVAWISQRKTVLATCLAFASAWLFIKHERKSGRSTYFASIVLFALSLAAKPVAALLPIALALTSRERFGGWDRRRLASLVPHLLLAAAFVIVGWWFQSQRAIEDTPVRDETLLQRTATAGRAFWFYLEKAVWPTNVAFVYERWESDVGSWRTWMPLFGAAALGLVALRWSASRLAFAWFVLMLFPAIGFVDVYYWRYSYVADHYQYPALPCVLALIAAVFVCGRVGAIVAIAVAVALGVSTWWYAHAYRSEESLWKDAIAKSPTAWLPHANLVQIYMRQGKTGEAIQSYRRVRELCEKRIADEMQSADRAMKAGDVRRAEAYLKDVVAIDPFHPEAKRRLGDMAYDRGNSEAALEHYGGAEVLERADADLRVRQGKALQSMGDLRQAAARFHEALALDPNHVEAQSRLAEALRTLNPK